MYEEVLESRVSITYSAAFLWGRLRCILLAAAGGSRSRSRGRGGSSWVQQLLDFSLFILRGVLQICRVVPGVVSRSRRDRLSLLGRSARLLPGILTGSARCNDPLGSLPEVGDLLRLVAVVRGGGRSESSEVLSN